MKPVYLIMAGCFLLASCSSPNISDNLKAVQQAYQLGSTSVRAELAENVTIERANELARRQADRLPVYQEVGQCVALGLAPIEGCARVEIFDPIQVAGRDTITASEAIAGLDAIENYLNSIALLADANLGPDISKQTSSLLGTANGLSQAANPSALAPISKGAIAFVAETAGYLTEQARLRRLRSVVRRGDAVLESIISDIVGRLDFGAGGGVAQFGVLNAARSAMNNARDEGTAAEYQAAAAVYKTKFDEYAEAQTNSSANHLRLLRAAHADLLARLNNPSVEEITVAITRIQTIRDLAEKAKGSSNE